MSQLPRDNQGENLIIQIVALQPSRSHLDQQFQRQKIAFIDDFVIPLHLFKAVIGLSKMLYSPLHDTRLNAFVFVVEIAPRSSM